MIMIDKLAYSSRLRYKSPCLKSFVAVSTLFICVIARLPLISLLILLCMGSLTVFIGKTSLKYYLKLMIIPLGFLILSTIAIIVSISDEPLSSISIALFGKYISITTASFYYGCNLILVSLAAVSCLYFLSLSTPVIDLLYVLKTIHCPELIIELLLLIYRFIFVLLDISNSIYTSQKCRLGNRNFKTSLKSASSLCAVMFIRALKKSSMLYDSMESRCYDGRINVLKRYVKAERKEIILSIIFEVALIIIAIICWRSI